MPKTDAKVERLLNETKVRKTMTVHILNKYSKEKTMLEAVGLNSHRKFLYSILRYATGKMTRVMSLNLNIQYRKTNNQETKQATLKYYFVKIVNFNIT